ncbi:MAG: aromatic amino acid lyase, partial [Chitinophagaceae bacterium]|nr:aromatic amino acid lyase [Chitinophagaceae bacterium]
CFRVVNNLEKVLAIELLSAAQALDYRRPMRSAPVLEEIVSAFRHKVSFNEKDRVLHTDMMEAVSFLRSTEIGHI